MTVVLVDLRSSSSSSHTTTNNNNNKSIMNNKILNTSTNNNRDDDDAPAAPTIQPKQRLIQKQQEKEQDITTSATLPTASAAEATSSSSSSSSTVVHLHHQHSNNNNENVWKKSLLSPSSTPPEEEEPSSSTQRHISGVVSAAAASRTLPSSCDLLVERTMEEVRKFYDAHSETIGPSHGLKHILKVHEHAVKAIASVTPQNNYLDQQQQQHWPRIDMEIQIAALLHDVDDSKYFPHHKNYENARSILRAVFHNNNNNMTSSNSNPPTKEDDEEEGEEETNTTTTTRTTTIINNIIEMISLVSCSKNGNYVPDWIVEQNAYYRLIPRWSDRLDTVGCAGVVRCYQYNIEHKRPLCGPYSPRATTEDEVWQYATPDRFVQYTKSGGASSLDMISHYYDKLLHVSRPPPGIVQNRYLEKMQQNSSIELVEMCVRYGKTGQIDYEYINEMMMMVANKSKLK